MREPAAEILSPAAGSTLIFACEAQWIRPQETCARPARGRRARPPRGGDGEGVGHRGRCRAPQRCVLMPRSTPLGSLTWLMLCSERVPMIIKYIAVDGDMP